MPVIMNDPPQDSLMRPEITPPTTPPANNSRIYFRSNSAGKSQLCVIHDDGSINVLSTQA
jgi:hypothetical protein